MEPCLIHKACHIVNNLEWEPEFPAHKNMRITGERVRWWRSLIKAGYNTYDIRRKFGDTTSETTIRTYVSDLIDPKPGRPAKSTEEGK